MADDDLVRLIREIIKQEMSKHSRLGTNELTSKTGDLNLTAMGNIFISPPTGKKAYYNGVEILTGGGGGGITGSGTINYIPKFTGASAIGNSSITDDGTTITTTAQSIVQNATAPGFILQSSGVDKTYLYFSTDSILRSLDTNLILRAQDVTKSIKNRIGTVDKLTINDTQIISTTHLYTNAKSIYVFDGDPNGAGTSRLSLTYLGNDGRVIGTNGYLRLAGASGIIAEDSIAMNSNKITGLGAGTAGSSDAARMVDIVAASVTSVFGRTGAVVATTNDYTWAQVNKTTSSIGDITTKDHHLLSGLADDDHTQYLLKTGGTLTGLLYTNMTTPVHHFQEAGATKLSIGWQNGPGGALNNLSGNLTIVNNSADIYIDAAVAAKSIYMRTGVTPTTRLTIADTLISSAIPLAVGDNVINLDSIEVNVNSSGNRYAYIDLHGDDTYTDYGLRLMRYNTGPNADGALAHRGTGALILSVDDAGSFYINVNAVSRFSIGSTGIINMHSNSIIGAPSIQAPAASNLTLKVSSGQSIVFQAV